MNIAGFYLFDAYIIVMIGVWILALYSKIVPQNEKSWTTTFHLLSESSIAIFPFVSGIGLLLICML